ncbi:semaphorin-1A-like isoform X6 [Patiria miniata]|uniref:Sema domain-containing protein n=1 Tax=Patiria miniata TaxID=46514 RepID=A0A914BSL4_PATMI|nr:semaphorin-1A-like isoform X6 [Patiria miniata]
MEKLLPGRRLVHRTWVILVLEYLVCYATVITATSGMFQDQVPKFVTSESYYADLRMFPGQSLTAMSLSLDGSQLYLGGKNMFFIMNLTQPFGQSSAIRNVSWVSETSVIDSCEMKGKQGWQCQNFVQVVLMNNETNRLLVCGTNAWAPLCRYFSPNTLGNYEELNGVKRCPFSPEQKSTAIFADGALYSAAVTGFTAVDSVIMRSMQGDVIETKDVDTKWLKVPEFIKSFEVGDWVVFFFREIAVEHVNSGEAIYSRVAKVCKNDIGGDWVLERKFTTFQKARLNCSFPGSFPFYFNYLQDVHMVGEGSNIIFYGVFTTGDHEIPGSAVCVFSLDKIEEIINEGQFKRQQQGTWYPVPVDDVPDPRPGLCAENSKAVPQNTLEFILAHPLMHQSVPNLGGDRPRFDLTRADFRIMQVVVHKQKAANDKTYDVLFLGTDDGRVLKVVIFQDTNGQYRSNLLEEIFISPRDHSEGVVNMEAIQQQIGQPQVILVNTNSTVVELPLQRCKNLTECACQQDPYCVYNNLSQMCVRFHDNKYDSSDVEDIRDCPKEEVPPPVPCTGKDCDGEDPDNLPTTIHPPAAVATSSSSPTSPRELITTPKKGTTLQTTEGQTTIPPRSTPRPPIVQNTDNEVHVKTSPTQKIPTKGPNAVDPYLGESVGYNKGPPSPVFWSFFAIGWLIAFILMVFLIHLFVTKRCKGNYQPTDTEESVLGSSYKPSPKIVKTVLPSENGKPPLMTSMQESPVRVTPVNGSLPQSRTHSLTPSTDPNLRNSTNGSYQPPRGSFTYGMDNSYLTPYPGGSLERRHPPTGGVDEGSPHRLPSETESRPSASGASDSEQCDDSDIWLKMPDDSQV